MPTTCSICGEYMEGDGYKVVLHCPNADEDQVACAEPDANPIECQEAENAPTPIDPFDQQHWNKPLFVVYGSTGFPQMLCCKVRLNDGVATIWGFSIWRRTPGFRTLGIKLKTWVERETDPRFYLSQEEAFEAIRETFNKAAPATKVKNGHPLILTDEEWSRLKSLTTLMQEQVQGNETFARAYLSGRTGAAKVVTDSDREQAAQHRKAAREYRSLIKSIKEQDPHG